MRSSPVDTGGQEFEKAFQHLYDPLVRRLVLMFRDSFIAEEAVQEAFCRALIRWDKFGDSRHLEAWLFVVARNVARDMLRRLSRSTTLNTSGLTSEADPAPKYSLDEIVGNWLIRQEIADAILRLPPTYREVLLLYYYEGYTVEEIAERSRTAAGTVKARLYRARQALRAALGIPSHGQEPPRAATRGHSEPPDLHPRRPRR